MGSTFDCGSVTATLCAQASSDRVAGSEVRVRLPIRQQGLWPRCTQLRQKLPFISVDLALGVTVVLNKMMSLCVQERPWCRREYTYVALKRWHKWAD